LLSFTAYSTVLWPADLGRVFLGSVLRVMDEEVRARDELGMLQIVPSDFALAVSEYA
jgi:hypothetical protein